LGQSFNAKGYKPKEAKERSSRLCALQRREGFDMTKEPDFRKMAEEISIKYADGIVSAEDSFNCCKIDDIEKSLRSSYLEGQKDGIEKHKEIVEAVENFVVFYEKHCAYEEEKTKRFQEAANLAREGKQIEARRIVQGCDNACRVFDYSKINKGLVNSLRRIRKDK
jgi:hypothetical protein